MTLPPSEKSPLPSIIVTPSSPGIPSPTDSPFFIAFLAPPQKPTLRQRISDATAPYQFKARTTIILLVLLFIMICHALTHRLASRSPRLEFSMPDGALGESPSVFEYFKAFWGATTSGMKRDFVITG
jgi:hypothetical protein